MTLSKQILLCGPGMKQNNQLRLGCEYLIITINPKTDNVIMQVLKPTQRFLLPRIIDWDCIIVSEKVGVLKRFPSLKSGCSLNKHVIQVS